jgi:hypothetical protein
MRKSSIYSSRCCLASFVYRPCLSNARRIRCRPSDVFGPELRPPCSLQRPFRIAGPRQAPPFRVLAPHLGAAWKSPPGLPFRKTPRCTWGLTSVLIFPPTFNSAPPPPGALRRFASHFRQSPGRLHEHGHVPRLPSARKFCPSTWQKLPVDR